MQTGENGCRTEAKKRDREIKRDRQAVAARSGKLADLSG
jgi:hypothetical protein